MDFAKTLKRLMELKGISRYKLAKEIPCSQASVGNWLNGVEPTPTPPPDPAVMQKISLSDRNIRERYYELTRQERQMLWRNMVESIVVRENVVDITWRQG